MYITLENANMLSTPTTNFLHPCNEDFLHPSNEELNKNNSNGGKKELERCSSVDVFPKKPHPFRSPMTYIRSSTLPRVRGPKKISSTYHSKLSVLPNSSGWSLDDECSYSPFAKQSKVTIGTTDDTPFTHLSDLPYYSKRQSYHGKPSTKSKSSKNSSCQYLNEQHHRRESLDDGSPWKQDDMESLRRRASSLDFLPEALGQQNVCNNNKSISPFARTASMSQRSPFRRKIAFPDAETSMAGLKEVRPKGAKRCKSGVDALFDSIERQDIEEVRKLIISLEVNINETNGDQFTPLDIALMNGENEIASVLLHHGAVESPSFCDPEERLKHMEVLIKNAESYVNDLTATVVNSVGDVKDNEKQLREWEWKLYMLRIMQTGFMSSDKPCDAPTINLAPLSNESIVVTLSSTNNNNNNDTENKDVITKYEVEWSRYEDFSVIEGDKLITDIRQLSYTVNSLEKNISWYFRARAGNIKGFSPYGYPYPNPVMPSSWHECNNSVPRYYGASDELGKLIQQLYSFQKQCDSNEELSDEENLSSPSSDVPRPLKQRSNGKKLTMKSLSKYTNLIFNTAPKLLKKMKGRGIYLASLLYSDDLTKVLVTMDENLPIVECDENYSKSFAQEFYWFSKASCTWEDIQHMLNFSMKSFSSQSVQIRRKLLQSALVLMNATGVTDLGTLHYKPFKDNHGSMLLLAVNCIKKQLGSRATTMKWIPISKLIKKNSSNEHIIMPEKLIPSVQEHVACHRRSRLNLPRGLYLGYLKLRTSVGTLSVIVPNSHTNSLPYIKIQDVPNVTKEEWQWLTEKDEQNSCSKSSARTFARRLKMAANKLFTQLGIPSEEMSQHRIYDQEVIELNSEVLFILICPSTDDICTPPNQTDRFTELFGYSALPVQAFEMSNMLTYQTKLMSSYSRLSSILELETFCTQQELRETICETHTDFLKQKYSKVQEFQQNVDECWKSSRWVVEAIQQCQDKNLNIGLTWSDLLSRIDSLIDNDSTISPRSSTSASEISFENSDAEINIIQKYDNILKVHGTDEIGLSESSCAEVTISEETTTLDIIQTAATQFLKTYGENAELDSHNNYNEILGDLKRLGLVVVSGSRERCLRDDLNIMELQNPWENGTLYLRLKKEAMRATKWGLTTSV